MEQIETSYETSLIDFILKNHRAVLGQKLSLIYEGEINQAITKTFTSLVGGRLEGIKEDASITKKVYHVIVECLQNVFKHNSAEANDDPGYAASENGVLVIGENK